MSGLKGARVLVTGGAGFIGSHLVDHLLDHSNVGHVSVVDNLVNGSLDNLAHRLNEPRFTMAVGDIRDDAVLETALKDVSVVFHLACLGVRHSLHAPVENHEVNASATLQLLEKSRTAGIGRFIHVSSSEVFGTAQFVPMTETHPTWPETVYGGSKLAGEAYARAFHRTHGFPAVVVRPFNTYGTRSHYEGDSGEMIPRTIVRLLAGQAPVVFGSGEQSRDFMHVSDTARGLAELASCDEAVGQSINFGSGTEITMNKLCEVIAHAMGRSDLLPEHLPARPGDVGRLLVDGSLIRALTGFQPEVSFDAGIREVVQWFTEKSANGEAMLARVAKTNWDSALDAVSP
ncbi:dTDP-glucose 4,6-dehydratase [Specibacter sp. NPDC057265]|uniref:dTDP-glucose 4,6-dehydratase n=1 Tax=Specibacter sp. NPDC057265 TaxID=3346075 RepID=UPI00364233C5